MLLFSLKELDVYLEMEASVHSHTFQLLIDKIVFANAAETNTTTLEVGHMTFDEVKKLLAKLTIKLKPCAREL